MYVVYNLLVLDQVGKAWWLLRLAWHPASILFSCLSPTLLFLQLWAPEGVEGDCKGASGWEAASPGQSPRVSAEGRG
jgi:hypothetical protein